VVEGLWLDFQNYPTVLRRLIGCLKLQVMFRLKAPFGAKEPLIIVLFCPKAGL